MLQLYQAHSDAISSWFTVSAATEASSLTGFMCLTWWCITCRAGHITAHQHDNIHVKHNDVSLGGANDAEDHDLLEPLVHVARSHREDVDGVRIILRAQLLLSAQLQTCKSASQAMSPAIVCENFGSMMPWQHDALPLASNLV